MHAKHLFQSALAILLVVPACAGSGGADPSPADGESDSGPETLDPHADGGAASVPDPITAPLPGDWASIIGESWMLEPGTEGYWCKRVTVAEDFWVSGIRAVAPPGTHHTTLGKDSGGPDGTFRCGGFSTGTELLFASGVGSDPVELAEGRAVKIAAGEKLFLNLHVFNVRDEALSGTSGIEMLALDSAAVVDEVAFVLAGVSGGLTVVPGESTQTGRCTMPVDVTVLSVWPHMHQSGLHQRVTARPAAGAPTVLLDAPYDFGEQRNVWLDPPALVPTGGQVEVTCTYQNESPNTLIFGESTGDEMCFAGLYHYPRFQPGSTCQK